MAQEWYGHVYGNEDRLYRRMITFNKKFALFHTSILPHTATTSLDETKDKKDKNQTNPTPTVQVGRGVQFANSFSSGTQRPDTHAEDRNSRTSDSQAPCLIIVRMLRFARPGRNMGALD